jgi:hypothetical protein
MKRRDFLKTAGAAMGLAVLPVLPAAAAALPAGAALPWRARTTARIWHIDAALGDDQENAGFSASAPLRSVTPLYGRTRVYQGKREEMLRPGDAILFRGGQSHEGPLHFAGRSWGPEGLVVSSYGTANGRPWIQHDPRQDMSPGAIGRDTLLCYKTSHITLSELGILGTVSLVESHDISLINLHIIMPCRADPRVGFSLYPRAVDWPTPQRRPGTVTQFGAVGEGPGWARVGHGEIPGRQGELGVRLSNLALTRL